MRWLVVVLVLAACGIKGDPLPVDPGDDDARAQQEEQQLP